MKNLKTKNMITKSMAATIAVSFFVNTVIADYAFSLQVPSQVGTVAMQEAAKDLYSLSVVKKNIERTRDICGNIGDFYFAVALDLADISHCKADIVVRKDGKIVTPQEIESRLEGFALAEGMRLVNAIADEILIRLSNGDIILRYWNPAAGVNDLGDAISVGERLGMRGERGKLAWDTYYSKEFAERLKAMVGTREVEKVAEELAWPLVIPETAPASIHPGEFRQAHSELTTWLIQALRASIVPIVALIFIAGYKLLTGDTADHTDHIGPSAGIGPIVLAGILLDQIGIRFAGFREWFTPEKRRPVDGYQRRRLAIEQLEGKQLLSPVVPIDLNPDLKIDNVPAMVGPLTAGEGIGGQMVTGPAVVDHAVTGLYSEGEAGPIAEGGVHSEWGVTVGTTTTYLTLDFRQLAMSWNGNTYVYHRDLDMVSYESPQDAGFIFSGRDYGKFTAAMNAMERNLRLIGEDGLADRLVSGELYNLDPGRREWQKTIGTTTTYLTLDSNQFAVSWNGNTYVYDRDFDMVYSLTSQDAGALVSRRGYGKFTVAMRDMERNLRLIGEDGLAEQLVFGLGTATGTEYAHIDGLVPGPLYNPGPAPHREWQKTIGTTTTYLTLDSNQFAVSWNGNTYVYHRDLDLVSYDTSLDAGFIFSRRGYGKFAQAMNDMERNLRLIGEDGLADRLVSGELYNYQQVFTPTPGTTIQIDAERSIYFATYNEWRITESATNRISNTVDLNGMITHFEVPDTGPSQRIFYDKNGIYIRGNIDNRAFEYGFDRFDDYVREVFGIRRLMYSWRDEIAKDPERAETTRLLDLAIVEFYNRMPAQNTAAYYYGTGGVLGVRALANGEIQRPAASIYYQGSLEGRNYWFDSIRPESIESDGSRVTARLIEAGIGQSIPPVFPWEEDILTPETGFNGITRPNDEQLREYLIRLDRVVELVHRMQGDIAGVTVPASEPILNQFSALRQRLYGAFGKAGIALPDAAAYTPGKENEYSIYRPNGDLETWAVQKVVSEEGVAYRFRIIRNEGNIRPDVNRDGFVTPIDVLIVVNFLNKEGTGKKDGPLDVGGDGFVTPIDALQVINYINNRPAAPGSSAQASAEAEAYISRINRVVSSSFAAAEGEAVMKAAWDAGKGRIVVDISGPKDEKVATAYIARPAPPKEKEHPQASVQPVRAGKTDDEDSVALTRKAAERLQAEGKTEATMAQIIGTLAAILGERELDKARERGLPFEEEKPDAERLKTVFRNDPNDNPVLVKVPVEALENLSLAEISERFGPYSNIGNLHIRLFSVARPAEIITERPIYEKYGLAKSLDKSCPIADQTKENTITLWPSAAPITNSDLQTGNKYAPLMNSVVMSVGRKDPVKGSDDRSGIMRGIYFGARGVQIARYVRKEFSGRQDVSYNDLKEPQIRAYLEKTVREYKAWLYVAGRQADELEEIEPQVFVDIATSIKINSVYKALSILIRLTPIVPFDLENLRKIRAAIELLEAAA